MVELVVVVVVHLAAVFDDSFYFHKRYDVWEC